MEITFLGTSGMVPTKDRGQSATLVSLEKEHILIDCGENVQRQMKIAGIRPPMIDKIIISHWHGDHILGIPGLLQTLYLNDYGKTLKIYGPRGTKKYMGRILELFAYKRRIEFKSKKTKR